MSGFDVAVVGAGAVGASCALHIARAGKKVLLIDAQAPASGSSGACSGLIALSTKKPGIVYDLAAMTCERYPALVASLPIDVEYRPSDSLLLIDADLDLHPFEVTARQSRERGVRMEFHDAASTRALEPNLADRFTGSLRCPDEYVVNPYLMTLGLVAGALARGVETRWRTRVLGVRTQGRRIVSLETTTGQIEAEQFVFAAGAASSALGLEAGLNLPVRPRRGELALTVRGTPLVRHYVMSARSIAAKNDPAAAARSSDKLARMGGGFGLHANASGQHFIGVTRDFKGDDRSNSATGLAAILAAAARYVPALEKVLVLRSFVGLRPNTIDGKPIIGRSSLLENLIVATGHDGDGISLSVVTGEIVSDLVHMRKPCIDVAALSPDRFELQEAG